MSLFQKFMLHLGYVPKSSVFNDVQDKVMNEAKVEEVQTTLMAKPQNIYLLKFYPQRYNRCSVHYGREYLCSCYNYQKDDVQNDFNNYKFEGYSTSEVQQRLKSKYNIPHSEAGRRGGKIGGKIGGKKSRVNMFNNGVYSFSKHNTRLLFNYRFDKNLERVCFCGFKEKDKVLNDCEALLNEGYTKDQIKFLLKNKYHRRVPNGSK